MRFKTFLTSCAGLIAFAATPVLAGTGLVTVNDPGTIGGFTGPVTVLATSDTFGNGTSTLSGGAAAGYGVSGDGSTLVGYAATPSGQAHAFAWTAAGGLTDLGALAPNAPSIAFNASADGKTIVGFSETATGGWYGFIWTAATGMVDMGTDNGPSSLSTAWAVSDDGSVVAGGSFTPTSIDRAMKWTQGGGWQNLGTLTGSGFSDAFGISGDGQVIVGESSSSTGNTHAFRWAGGTMTDLGTIGGVNGGSVAADADHDGGVVVGVSTVSGQTQHAFRWTQADGMADLGTLDNATGDSRAFAVNSDGSVVVGKSVFNGAGTHAFVWTAPTGMQDLNTLLSTAGVDMTGIDLTVARGVSNDGNFVAGSGTFPTSGSASHAFLARIGGDASGVTTPDSVVQSISDLAESHFAQMITEALNSMTYLGVNEQVSCGDCGGAYASFGSFNLSAHGRHRINEEWTALGGMGYGRYQEKGADVSGSISLAGALRFDPAHMGASRPYFEFGGTFAPSQLVTYNRPYVNGSGTATGTGETRSGFYSVYVRAGWVARLSRVSELAGALSLSHIRQSQDGYSEIGGAGNPFDAIYTRGRDDMDVVSADAQYTHLFGRRLEVTADVAVSQSFNARSGIHASIAGFGPQDASAKEHMWAQPGLRIGYRARKNVVIDAFVNATIGPKDIGTGVHGGVGVTMRF